MPLLEKLIRESLAIGAKVIAEIRFVVIELFSGAAVISKAILQRGCQASPRMQLKTGWDLGSRDPV